MDPMESYVSVEENREHQRYLSADREYDCFFVGNRLEEEKVEGTADGIESVKESDQDQEGNAFEIIDDKNREHDI